MTDERDPDDVLHRLVPADLADRLLAGPADAVDVSPAVDEVVALLEALRAPKSLEERAAGSTAAATFAAAVRAGTAVAPEETVIVPMSSRRPRAKAIAAIATVAVLSVGTAAAAASGGMTDALSRLGITAGRPDDKGEDQDDVPTVESTVESTVPDTAEPTTTATATTEAAQPVPTDASSATTTAADVPTSVEGERTTPVGPDPTGPAKHGLCTAYFASGAATGPNGDSVAMRNVADAAAEAGQTVEEFCADVLGDGTGDADGRGNGKRVGQGNADQRDDGDDDGTEVESDDDGSGSGNGNSNGSTNRNGRGSSGGFSESPGGGPQTRQDRGA